MNEYYYIKNIENNEYLDWYSGVIFFTLFRELRNWKFKSFKEAELFLEDNFEEWFWPWFMIEQIILPT